jgi:hypothetical protein
MPVVGDLTHHVVEQRITSARVAEYVDLAVDVGNIAAQAELGQGRGAHDMTDPMAVGQLVFVGIDAKQVQQLRQGMCLY